MPNRLPLWVRPRACMGPDLMSQDHDFKLSKDFAAGWRGCLPVGLRIKHFLLYFYEQHCRRGHWRRGVPQCL